MCSSLSSPSSKSTRYDALSEEDCAGLAKYTPSPSKKPRGFAKVSERVSKRFGNKDREVFKGPREAREVSPRGPRSFQKKTREGPMREPQKRVRGFKGPREAREVSNKSQRGCEKAREVFFVKNG